ncbi:MAG: hypothetical protein K6F44_08465 [Lachnospiraceae bacterium]|nr:hypothetical protein [Lachnospiraceae bacterium]
MSSGINITLTRGNVEEHKTVLETNYESMYTSVQQAQEVGAQVPDYFHKDKRMMLRLYMRQTVPSVVVTKPKAAQVPASAERYTEKEAKKLRKEYKKAAAKGKVKEIDLAKFANSDYMKTVLDEKVENCDLNVTTQRELYRKCKEGQFNDFEKLDPILRDTLAIEYTKEKMSTFMGLGMSLEKIVDELDQAGGHEMLAHPLLRLGISLGIRGQADYGNLLDPEKCKELDDLLNARIMRNTLISEVGEEESENLSSEGMTYDEKRVSAGRDAYARAFIMKSLLLAQLGSFKKISGDGSKKSPKVESDWDRNVATAFAHCSRVMYTLPSEKSTTREKAQAFRVDYMDENKGFHEQIGFVKRGAATHRASAASGSTKAKEQKWKLGWYFDQSGINVAVGGLGKRGIGGRILKNDGSCGHLYRYYREGSSSEQGVMMLGFESDAFKKKNQLGHTHGLGNGEYCSSFGGQRVDEIGNKYGGRTVDASKVNMDLVSLMFQAVDRIVLNAEDVDAREQQRRMTKIADLLSGKRIAGDETAQRELLTELFGRCDEEMLDQIKQGWQ